MALVLRGTVVTMDADRKVLRDGAVYLGDDGLIDAVGRASAQPPTGFAGAPVVRTRGVIYPGLVDLHSHVMYNTLPLWQQPGRVEPYINHSQWPRANSYGPEVSQPGRLLGMAAGRALLDYVEAKAIVGGTTTIQGNPRGARPPDGHLVRNVDTESLGTKQDFIKVTTIVATEPEGLLDAAVALSLGKSFVYHLAEGTDPKLDKEYQLASDAGLLQDGFIGIHGTGLTAAQLRTWAGLGGTLVWSPFSNYWLYGGTADVTTAKEAGLRLCLGSDWSPSGTKQLLGELKVADIWNAAQAGPVFTDDELCAMVTANPGDALTRAWKMPIGRVVSGGLADLVVLRRRRSDLSRNLIDATERDVRLVVVGGRPRYGLASLMRAAGSTNDVAITVAGLRRRIDLGQPGRTWAAVKDELEEVRADPVAAKLRADEALAAWAGPLDDPDAPFVFLPDMPTGTDDDTALGGPGDPPEPIEIPPLEPLAHDSDWFDTVDTNPFHRGLLSGMRAYYA